MLATSLGKNYFRKVIKMKKYLIAAVFGFMSITTAQADELADMYFTGKNPELTSQEKAGMAIAKRWKAGAAQNVTPVTGKDGSIQFLYGAQQTSIVCAVLQICDVALQPGEQIIGQPHLGDAARWVVEPAITGSGETEVQHIIIKPLDVGLETSLMVPTDRRTYHFKLKSHKTQYMPKVSFSYPEDVQAKWAAIQQRETKERVAKTIPQTGEYLGDLDFVYTLKGKADWKPVRVYNDGVKTIIQMPTTMNQTEAPTLLVLRGKGSKDTVIVNYRVQGDRYVVDSVFDKAILIAGVGRKQDKVTITRGDKKSKSTTHRSK